MTIFAFILAICYVPGWTGYAIPTGWLFLGATLPFLLRRRLATANWFLLYASIGLLWTPIWQQGIYDLYRLAVLSMSFLLGTSQLDSRRLYVGMAVGFSFSTLIGMVQLFGWDGLYKLEGFTDPGGLFVNPNVFGEVGCLITIGLLASGAYWPVLLTAPAVLISHSRTALLACGLTGGIWLWKRYSLMGPIVILFGSLIATSAFFDKGLKYVPYRLAIWQNTIEGLTLWGRGPGSFIITYPVFAKRTDTMTSREEDAHNDFLQIVYQYGLGGTILLLPILLVGLFGPLGPERYVLIGFCVIALFNFPLAIPCEGFLGAFALGRCWRNRPVVWRDWILCRWLEQRWMGVPQPNIG